MLEYQFKLFVSGKSRSNELAIKNLQILIGSLAAPCGLEVIDIKQEPERAEQEHIVATPTLIRYSPEPVKRIIGDMADVKQLIELIQVSDIDT